MSKPGWIATCERLWGADWVAPLSDVLGVNRRTVYRWRDGVIALPSKIEVDILRLGDHPRDVDRAYGDVLRRLALGENVEDIEASIRHIEQALARYRSDLGRFTAIDILSKEDV